MSRNIRRAEGEKWQQCQQNVQRADVGGAPPPPNPPPQLKWHPPPPNDDGRYIRPGRLEGCTYNDLGGEGCVRGILVSAFFSSSTIGGKRGGRRGETTKSSASAAAGKIGNEQLRSQGLVRY